jgi:hypothetical protein
VVDAMKQMRERHRFIRGMVAWIGGKQVPLVYDRKARVAGESKYPLAKMVRFAADAITAFSVVPLMASMTIGWVMAAVGFAFFVYSIVGWTFGHTLPGWTSLMAAVLLGMRSDASHRRTRRRRTKDASVHDPRHRHGPDKAGGVRSPCAATTAASTTHKP